MVAALKILGQLLTRRLVITVILCVATPPHLLVGVFGHRPLLVILSPDKLAVPQSLQSLMFYLLNRVPTRLMNPVLELVKVLVKVTADLPVEQTNVDRHSLLIEHATLRCNGIPEKPQPRSIPQMQLSMATRPL